MRNSSDALLGDELAEPLAVFARIAIHAADSRQFLAVVRPLISGATDKRFIGDSCGEILKACRYD